MTSTQIKLQKQGYTFNANIYSRRNTLLMMLGRQFPATKAQAEYFIKNNCTMDVLNYDDVQIVESLLNKHGLAGDYKYTKSESWVRLLNHDDLEHALKLEYSL